MRISRIGEGTDELYKAKRIWTDRGCVWILSQWSEWGSIHETRNRNLFSTKI